MKSADSRLSRRWTLLWDAMRLEIASHLAGGVVSRYHKRA
jgi:hypothetical protein